MKHRLLSTKLCLLVLAVFVALGAVFNGAIAIVCSLWGGGKSWVDPYSGIATGPALQRSPKPLPKRVCEVHALLEPPEDPGGHTSGYAGFGIDYYNVEEYPPGEARTGQQYATQTVFTGWPVKAFWAYEAVSYQRHSNSRRVVTEQASGFLRYGPRWIPYLPIWSGIVVNTVFYATILMLLWFGPRGLRRWWRHRHGRCRLCGYILVGAGAGCPECGNID